MNKQKPKPTAPDPEAEQKAAEPEASEKVEPDPEPTPDAPPSDHAEGAAADHVEPLDGGDEAESIPEDVRRQLDDEAHRIAQEQAEQDQSRLTDAGAADVAAMGNDAQQRVETFGGDGQTKPWVTIRGATVLFRAGDFGSLQIGTRAHAQSEQVAVAVQLDPDEFTHVLAKIAETGGEAWVNALSGATDPVLG